MELTVPPNCARLIELQRLLATFGPDEIEAFWFIAKRHAVGRERYGELRVLEDARDFEMEAAEEGSDLISYLMFDMLRRVLLKKMAA